MKTRMSKLFRVLGLIFASLIILFAVLNSVTRLLTPILNDHKTDFERIAGSLLMTPVKIGRVRAAWQGYQPEIALDEVRILEAGSNNPKLSIARFDVYFNIWQSLLKRQVEINRVSVSGLALRVSKTRDGEITVGDLGSFNVHDTLSTPSSTVDKLKRWVFSQPLLVLQNVDLEYEHDNHAKFNVTLANLSLRNTDKKHAISGSAILNQTVPTKVDLQIAWTGDVNDLMQTHGHLYLYLEGLSLPQWFSQFSWQHWQVRQGMASLKVWANWGNQQLQKVQSQFQLYDLDVYSLDKKTHEKIDRLSANAGWKREGNTQIIAADQVTLDLPFDLWPVTSFAVKIADADTDPHLEEIKVSYLNLVDAYRWALLFNVPISDAMKLALAKMDPKGGITNLAVVLPKTFTSWDAIHLQAGVENVVINAWEKVPAIYHLDGDITWDGEKGRIQIQSTDTIVTVSSVFRDPLFFKKITADVSVSKDNKQQWSLVSKELTLSNDDVDVSTNVTLDFPDNASPVIDLTGTFTLKQAAHVTTYLPLKIFDPSLVTWLQGAFISGSATQGQATLKGSLTDFPYDHNNGTFLLTTAVKDIDLQFAPDWPHLTKIQGNLIYSGRTMSINLNACEIDGISVQDVRAVIPYFGDAAPQVLDVKTGVISADLARGMHVIHHSPLEKTLGRDLASLDLSGPMQMTLGLVVPLKNPDDIKVNGDVTFKDSVVALPDWKLTLNKMQGGFQFTDADLTAKQIQGALFDTPVNLVISTVLDAKKVKRVKANLNGNATIKNISDWLQVSLTPYLAGAFQYQVELLMASHESNASSTVSLTTTMQGVNVNLPAPYGKGLADVRNTQVTLTFNASPTLGAAVQYANLMSAALNLQKSGMTMQVQSGEVRLGNGKAQGRNELGIIVTGDMSVLDWNTWQNYFASLKLPASTSNFDLFQGVDLRANTIQALGQSLHAAHLEASRDKSNWILDIDSQEITGRIVLPNHLSNYPVEGEFQHIYLGSLNSQDKSTLDPRTLPAMNITSRDVQFDGKRLGGVRLNIMPSKSGVLIKAFEVDDAAYHLAAVGDWSVIKGKQLSHLQGDIKSREVSTALKAWGLGSSNFIGSVGSINFDLSWPNAPYRLNLAGLTGKASLTLGEGRIIQLSEGSDAKMGLGRLLNIFSLSTIPRRLSLDFSDLFEKGYSFDSLKGSFTLRDGDANTTDMLFEGPVAVVGITGRVGLAKKDFNFELNVTPHVTSSLPVVATIAGGPVVGVATWFVDKVISREVSKATTYRYSVTGAWDKPVWQELGETQPKH